MFKEFSINLISALRELAAAHLSPISWGNISIKSNEGFVAIKPSGCDPNNLSPNDIPIYSLRKSAFVHGELKPSSDFETHLHLYNTFVEVGSIVHTHSKNATAWAQSNIGLPNYGTTHSDHFLTDIPITRQLAKNDIESNYGLNVGISICQALKDVGTDYLKTPGVLVASHGPFCWGKTAENAIKNAIALEFAAELGILTHLIKPTYRFDNSDLAEYHYYRKNGVNSFYGQ